MKPILSFFPILLSLSVFAQQPHTLSYKMEQGKSYRYQRESNITATQEMIGTEMTVKADLRYLTEYVADEVTSDGRIILTGKILEGSVHTNIVGKDTTIQITGETSEPVRTEMTVHGKTLSDGANDSSARSMSMDMGFIKQPDFMELSDQPVSVGEKWTLNDTDTIKSEGSDIIVTSVTTGELVGTESRNGHDCLKIAYTTTYEMNGKMMQSGMEMFLEGEGEAKGTIWFDEGKGLLTAQEGVTTQDITIAITGQTPMTIPSSQVINQKSTLIE